MRRLLIWLILLLTAVTGCTLLPTETGIVPTATPVGDMISFNIPLYSTSMSPNSSISGAPMRYLRRSGDAYTMEINWMPIDKRVGDSFNWQGVIAPGVYANYNLRLTTAILDSLPVAGSVEFLIFNPQPRDIPLPADRSAYLAFNNVVVDYLAPVGREIPGTTMIYDGVVTTGQGDFATTVAKLVSPLNTRQLSAGDSFTEIGAIRDNVFVEYNVRVIRFDENTIHLTGLATLWINPTPQR